MKSSASLPRTLIHLLILAAWMSVLPPVFASQQASSHKDSISILQIIRYKRTLGLFNPQETTDKVGKLSYIAAGAIVDITLENGRVIKQVPIEMIGKDHLLINDEQIPFDSIQRIKVGEAESQIWPYFLAAITIGFGLFCTVAIFLVAYSLTSAVYWFLLMWIPGIYLIRGIFQIFPRFKLKKAPYSMKVVNMYSLPERVQKRLNKPKRFYHHWLRRA